MVVLGIVVAAGVCRAAGGGDLALGYDHPARDWQSECLPIGNGRLGAMMNGDPVHEHIQFNEDSLWTGDEKDTGNYQNFGELTIDFKHADDTSVTTYRRNLNLAQSIETVDYQAGGVHYHTEAFASHPADILIFRYTADKPNAFTGDIKVIDAHGAPTECIGPKSVTLGADSLSRASFTMHGTLNNGLRYASQVRMSTDGGSLTSQSGTLHFLRCNSLEIRIDARTNYSSRSEDHWRSDPPEPRVQKCLDDAEKSTLEQLREAHLRDYQGLFDRVSIDVGKTADSTLSLPTDARLASYSKGGNDPELEALMYQFGRYLLISSSRNALPANLQGLWNHSNTPPWRCDYHSDINVQMNYWPAEVANLSECTKPFFDYLESLRKVRTAATRNYYLNEVNPHLVERKPVRGWTVQTENGVFGGSSWHWNVPGSAWYCDALWQHYAFTQDQKFLRATAYPIMKEVAEFWEDHLVPLADGTLVTPDGWSPEHGPDERGVSYDQEIVFNLFSHMIEAMKVLGVDPQERQRLEIMREKLLKPKIGKWGQLQEWMEDRDDPRDQHRHISHLFALFPGDQISVTQTPALAKAAAVSLEARGDQSTGWAMAWRVSCWARLLQSEHAYHLLRSFFHLVPPQSSGEAGGVYGNLLCSCPPFEIDGNFGYVAGVSEMLLQSQGGEIHLLPALPKAWANGHITGLRARGNIEVDMEWADGKLVKATLHGIGNCRVRYGDAVKVIALKGSTVLDGQGMVTR
jgi:alpha-L-fucosidase 2